MRKTQLSIWLKSQLKERRVTAQKVAVSAGVGGATISNILNMGHVPQIDVLLRLADYFGTPRPAVLCMAADLAIGPANRSSPEDDDYLIEELNEAFRQIPDEWKEEVLVQVKSWARHATPAPVRIIGGEEK